jgi:uncharacterized protein (TIGR02246 family)
MSNSEQAVRDVVAKINAAWRLRRFDGLAECFHEDAVIVGPGYVEMARGREKCVESYRDFASSATVLSYSESTPSLWIWEATAVCTYSWEMQYQSQGGVSHEAGTDQLVLALVDGRWQVVWRYLYFEPRGSVDSNQ